MVRLREVVTVVVTAFICGGFASYMGAQRALAQQEVLNKTYERRLGEADILRHNINQRLSRMEGMMEAMLNHDGIPIPLK